MSEKITMYRVDNHAPEGVDPRVSFGTKSAEEWQEEMETQGFIYTPEEKRIVSRAVKDVMEGKKSSDYHEVIEVGS